MRRVLILLSTYNGEKYLREQLDSILSQKDVDITVLVRDDGSKDSTCKILEEYKTKHKNIVVHIENNIGCKKSFFTLLKYAKENHNNYDYYAFSDQDDVWLDDKLISAIKLMEQSDSPCKFYSSGSTKVDCNLNKILQRNEYKACSFGNNIISSNVLGCTSVFSKSIMFSCSDCYDIVINLPDHLLPYHDAYSSLVAFALDSYMVFDNNSHILYRQHGHNLVGGDGQSALSAQMGRLRSPYRRFTKIRILLASVNHKLISPDKLELLQLCANANRSFASRMKLIKDKRMRGFDWEHTLFFWINILLKKW